MFLDLLIGGFSGAISRTITAPLELSKIQKQNKFMKNTTLISVIKKEGFFSLWKGNGINVIRIFPQMSINYSICEFFRNDFFPMYQNKQINIYNHSYKLTEDSINFFSGAISGSISMTMIYPLENIRSRLSLQSNKTEYKGILDVIKKTKINKLYGGLKMSLMGFTPYNAFNFMFYYRYKKYLNEYNPNNKTFNYLTAGGLSGISAITITYPTDLIRRRLQIQGMNDLVPKYDGILDVIKKIYGKEGIIGLYRGLLPCYLKVFPAISIQFYMIEILKSFIYQ